MKIDPNAGWYETMLDVAVANFRAYCRTMFHWDEKMCHHEDQYGFTSFVGTSVDGHLAGKNYLKIIKTYYGKPPANLDRRNPNDRRK